MKCQSFTFDDISPLDSASLDLKIEKKDLAAFVALTGDENPLHCDAKFGAQSSFKNNVVHGLLTTSFASTLVGMLLPGRNCLILSTHFDFLKPVFLEEKLRMLGVVEQKNEQSKTLKIQFSVSNSLE